MTFFKPKIFLFLILPICVFLSFNKHSKDREDSCHGVIVADAAGYYVHNPIWFIYGNNALNFPDSIDVKTGNGFRLDYQKNKVITKYPVGVAILQSPFFLISHFLSKPFGYKADGFSKIYSFGIYLSGVLYCCLGLYFLSIFLSNYFSAQISILAPLVFLIGTNLFYYSIDCPGMSHIYSFFLFSLLIYLSPRILSRPGFKNFTLFFTVLFLATLTRPTNILIGLFPFVYDINKFSEIKQRLQTLLRHKFALFSAILLSSLIFFSQILYWKNASGKLISYSYNDEAFIFYKNPKFLEIWFSANNGLFIYSPLILISIAGILFMVFTKKISGFFYAGLFLLISYIFASWWCWWFGCSFGARSFVEYYAVLIIPFCYLLEYSKNSNLFRAVISIAILLFCYLNIDIEYYYDGCFYGKTWDFEAYFKLLNS